MGSLTGARRAAYRVGYHVRATSYRGWYALAWARHEGYRNYLRRQAALHQDDLRAWVASELRAL